MSKRINVIIRIDDIVDKYDIYELKSWFLSNFPNIPINVYLMATHHKYKWPKQVWLEVKDLIQNFNWEFGGHTRHHPHLSKISLYRLKLEILGNIDDIEKNLKKIGFNYKITSFAYPYGDYDNRVKELLRKNGIIHGLTYNSESKYKSQLIFPTENLFEINISCNVTNSIDDWNERFMQVYDEGDTYILCLHTSHWNRGRNRLNLSRIIRSRSVKELYMSIRRFFEYLFKKSNSIMWNYLEEHLKFISNFPNVKFLTFKDLLDNKE